VSSASDRGGWLTVPRVHDSGSEKARQEGVESAGLPALVGGVCRFVRSYEAAGGCSEQEVRLQDPAAWSDSMDSQVLLHTGNPTASSPDMERGQVR
jgi:hypothetical protein